MNENWQNIFMVGAKENIRSYIGAGLHASLFHHVPKWGSTLELFDWDASELMSTLCMVPSTLFLSWACLLLIDPALALDSWNGSGYLLPCGG